MKRLAIVSTHAIQYYAPLFRLLASEKDIEIKVFYTWSQSKQGAKYDRDFGKMIEWDIPLLDGYTYEYVENTSVDPGVHHFKGIVNPSLNSRIAEWKPDFLMVVGWNFKSHLAAMRHFKGRIPVLFRGDSTLLDEIPGIKKILRRIFLSWVYRHVDFALFVGKNNYDYFIRHGLKEKQLIRMPHAVDNQRFYGPARFEEEASVWRKELGLSESDLVVLFAGKLEPKKDPDFMLRLAHNLTDTRLKIIIVGNGVLEAELKKQAGSDPRIIFLDFQNQQKMPLVYRLCDIFILPSKGPGETWGLSVNEAMACQRPAIVSSKCGCAPDLIEDGKTGWVFEPGETGDLQIKNLLEGLLDNKQIPEQMGRQAWEKLKSFSYSVAIEKLKSFLRGNGPK